MKSWGCNNYSCRRSSGRESNHCCRRREVPAGRGRILVACSMASSGCSIPGRGGAICPKNIPARPRARGAWLVGKNKVSGSLSGELFFRNCVLAARWIGRKVFRMPVSLRLRKGRLRRQNQTGQGHEVDGGGRRLGCSIGKPTGRNQPGGSDFSRKHVARDLAAAAPRLFSSASHARDRRSWLRQRSLELALAATRHPADCSASQRPQETYAHRRSANAPLLQTLEDRTDGCLAGQLPTFARTSRPSFANV